MAENEHFEEQNLLAPIPKLPNELVEEARELAEAIGVDLPDYLAEAVSDHNRLVQGQLREGIPLSIGAMIDIADMERRRQERALIAEGKMVRFKK